MYFNNIVVLFGLRNVCLFVCMYVCMYVCMRAFVTRRSYSLSSHHSRVRAKPKRCVFSLLQKSVNVNVGSRSDGGREFHSFGAQAAKLRGPKLVVRQASTCRSPRAAERRLGGDDLY